jgi:hypothetical protein
LELLPGEIGLLVGTALLFGWVTVTIRDVTAVFAVVWQEAVTLDSLGAWGVYRALVATIVVTLVLHESIHAVVARWRGCEARISSCCPTHTMTLSELSNGIERGPARCLTEDYPLRR